MTRAALASARGSDTEAADLDLVVDAPQVLQRAVRAVAHPVARAVEPPVRAPVGVGDEALGGQRRAVQVAAGQPGAADEQLAGDSYRSEPQVAVEHARVQVGQGHADDAARAVAVGAPEGLAGHVHRRLGDAVHVVQPRALLAVPLEPRYEGA